jgi:hypothetical protein
MKRIDFKQEFGEFYFPRSKEVTVVDVPAMNFASVDGKGDPNTSASYREAIEALYGVSYALKFALKFSKVADYKVGPLESLWWSDEGGALSLGSKERWNWTAMIMQPDVVSLEAFRDAVNQVRAKRNPPALSHVRFGPFHEGQAAQILYVGPYASEGPTIERIHQFIRDRGGHPSGKHHEIYLGDPRRSVPERLKTVIRQPFRE